MELRWQLFAGGHIMFWITIILFIILIFGFIGTYIIDPMIGFYMKVLPIDNEPIKSTSEKYVESLNIKINKKIVYRFVKFNRNKDREKTNYVLLGTFHVWNNTFYIDISSELCNNEEKLEEVILHETRHMVVEYLREQGIINLSKYTEEIAENKENIYNYLFNNGIFLLQKEQEKESK